jgi:lysophospholipase L1-like esterase
MCLALTFGGIGAIACSGGSEGPPAPGGGSGSSGTAGSAPVAGTAGAGGAGGPAGPGGASGAGRGGAAGAGAGGAGRAGGGGVAATAGNSGSDGGAGSGAIGGAGTAGTGGSAGSAGTGGSAGTAEAGGSAGTAGASGGVAGAGGGGAELSDWQFYGRWDLTMPGRAVTVNSGSHVVVKFNGSGLSAQFDVSGNTGNLPTVTIELDDEPVVEKEIAGTLELASGLEVTEHTLTLFVRGMNENEARWTPPLVAATTFLGFEVTGGAFVKAARPERLKMELLGDSITEGVALHGQGPQGQTTANWRTDGPRGYASLTARAMNAEWRQVGFGRQGLTIVGNGGVPKAQDAFNWFYQGVPRDDWQPDWVVVNQGTNDGGANSQTFSPLYFEFLGLIRTAYPDATIAALRPFNGAHAADISAQVTARRNAGDMNVFYVDTSGWTSSGDFTDGVHPNEAGSVKIAGRLVTALQALLP